MTTEREEALELAREAGVMPDALSGHYIATEDVLIRIVRLAKQLGAEGLSAANARIAELEEAVRRNGIKVSSPLGSLLSPHDIIEPSQPTTLPESKQQK